MEWSIDDARPIYAQLMEQIEQEIVSGGFLPGDRLPGVRELASQAGVNPNTMQRALAELESRGLVHSRRTSGRFVTQDEVLVRRLRRELSGRETQGYLDTMAALGCGREEITQAVAQALQERDEEGKE